MIYGISIKILPLKFITLSMSSDISSQIECGYIIFELSDVAFRVRCARSGAHSHNRRYFSTISIKRADLVRVWI